MGKLIGSKKSQVNQKHPWTVPTHAHNLPKVKDEEIVLKDGEELCDKCEGSGLEPQDGPQPWYRANCSKCQGEKKVDWISNITGVKEKEYIIGADSSASMGWSASYATSKLTLDEDIMVGDKSLSDYVRNIAAQELADKIDGEILRNLEGKWQQNNKKNKGWRKIFDNRIFSKLLFFDNSKQKNKSKKNTSII